MNRTEHLLTILNEECNETAQRGSKAIRFGLREIQKDQPFTNAERIVYEFNDIMAVMELLLDEGSIQKIIDRDAIEKKKEKIKKYMDYSVQCGTMEEKK